MSATPARTAPCTPNRGYSRLQQYLTNLGAAMDAAGAGDLDAFVEKTSGGRGRRFPGTPDAPRRRPP